MTTTRDDKWNTKRSKTTRNRCKTTSMRHKMTAKRHKTTKKNCQTATKRHKMTLFQSCSNVGGVWGLFLFSLTPCLASSLSFPFPFPHTLPDLSPLELHRTDSSLLLLSLLQLDLRTVLYFFYRVLLERGRENGESWGWVYAYGNKGGRAEDAEGEKRELQRRMASSSDQAEYWMTVLQVGAEAVLRSSEWYISLHVLSTPLHWSGKTGERQQKQAEQETEVPLEPIKSYQI